jgi:hypothetical protein
MNKTGLIPATLQLHERCRVYNDPLHIIPKRLYRKEIRSMIFFCHSNFVNYLTTLTRQKMPSEGFLCIFFYLFKKINVKLLIFKP